RRRPDRLQLRVRDAPERSRRGDLAREEEVFLSGFGAVDDGCAIAPNESRVPEVLEQLLVLLNCLYPRRVRVERRSGRDEERARPTFRRRGLNALLRDLACKNMIFGGDGGSGNFFGNRFRIALEETEN